MTNFTKKELYTLYWILVQYIGDCEPRYKTDKLSKKIGTMWSEL